MSTEGGEQGQGCLPENDEETAKSNEEVINDNPQNKPPGDQDISTPGKVLDTNSRSQSGTTDLEKNQKGQPTCKQQGDIWRYYRFGLIMQTILTLALLVGWSVVWQPVRDGIYYQILKYPEPSKLDPDEVNDFMKQTKQNSECNLTELQKKFNELQKNYSSLQQTVLTLEANSTEFNKTLVKHEEEINITSSSLETIGVNVTDFKGKLQHQSEQTSRVQKDINRTLLKMSEEIWQYLLIIVAIGEMFLVIYVIKLKSLLGDRGRQPQPLVQPTKTVKTPHTNGDRNDSRPRSVLNGAFNTSTENSVCVLSFNGDPAHKKHLALSRSFLEKKVKVTDVVIKGEDDILNIPPSKMVLVHVDFNARNIILENPDREIGELRRTTVKALWRMNADVVLFYYYEERNTKPLGDHDLYSSDLGSVRTQTELKRLEEQQRFISLNGQLSDRQKNHLRELVKARIG